MSERDRNSIYSEIGDWLDRIYPVVSDFGEMADLLMLADVNEIASATCRNFAFHKFGYQDSGSLRQGLIHLAVICVGWVEQIDKQKNIEQREKRNG